MRKTDGLDFLGGPLCNRELMGREPGILGCSSLAWHCHLTELRQGREGVVFVQIPQAQDFPGGAVVKTPCSQCRGVGFYPWSGN